MAEAVPMYEYRCLICIEPYTDPRLLLCGHTFCCRCLSSYINAEYVTADDRLYFPCPVCETPTYNDDVNADVSTWATCLPKNDLLSSSTAQMSGVQFCDPCLRGKESNPADVSCLECNELLCKLCKTHHERSKVSASHQLTSIFENLGQLAGVRVYEICHQHDVKPLELYCIDHSTMCCNICVSVSHRQCNNVKPMKDVIKKTKDKLNIVESEWKEVTEETKKMISEDDLGIVALNAKENEVLTKMTGKIDEAKEKLDNIKATFQSNVAYQFKKLREPLLSRQNCNIAFRTNAENSHQLMSDSNLQLSDHHRFVMREHTKNQIWRHYRLKNQHTKIEPNRFDVTLKLDKTIDTILNMTTVGEIEITSSLSPVTQKANGRISSLIESLRSTPSATNFVDTTSTSDLSGSLQHLAFQTAPVTTVVDAWTGSVPCVHTVNVRSLGGKDTPWLTGGIFTDNYELLITDYSNNRLLLFDGNYSYLREYKIDGRPTDIARGRSADEIFVGVNRNSIMRCILRNGQLFVITKISGPLGTYGIAFHGENILVSNTDCLKVLSVDGKVINSIKKAIGITYLAISTSNTSIYHRDKDDLVCRRLDNEAVVHRYRDPGLKDPCGIGLDQDHNVYVCGHRSGNVYLISPDGSRGRIILPKLSSITNPWCIVVHPTKQEFVVTSNRESTSLEVYRFSDKK